MNRHSFRWTGLAFGALFLAVAANWVVWQGDLLTGRQMSYVVSGVLIAAGLLGVVATFRRPTSPASTPTPTTEAEAAATNTNAVEDETEVIS